MLRHAPTLGPRRVGATLVALVLSVTSLAATAAAQDFYRERLERGRQALGAQRFAEAATDLEIACFGLMENPARRAGCKALLFLAQRNAGDVVAATETLRLVARLEERFAAFSGANLDAQTRRAFLLEADASQVDLGVWPRLRQAVEAVIEVQEVAPSTPENLSLAELQRAFRADPSNIGIATRLVIAQYERGKFADVQNTAEDLLAADPENATAGCLLAVATATRNRSMCASTLETIEMCSADLQNRRYARTRLQCYVDLERWQDGRRFSDQLSPSIRAGERRLIRQIERRSADTPGAATPTRAAATPASAPKGTENGVGRPQAAEPALDPIGDEIASLRRRQGQAVQDGDVEELADILDDANRLAERHPENGSLRELAGQAAFLLSRWDQAVFHLQAADAAHEVGAFSLFYLATALEATGDIDAARDVLQRGLDAGLPRAPQVIALEQKVRRGA